MSVFTQEYWAINALSDEFDHDIQQRVDRKTKPPGSLGQLEALAVQLARIQKNPEKIEINRPTIIVFAADHGIARHNISIAPQVVTQQMVQNFLAGGAAINCFCHANEAELVVVDAGLVQPVIDESGQLKQQAIALGTQDFSQQPAMTISQCEHALQQGAELAISICRQDSNVLGFGEMGIGNTSSAAAILAALLGLNGKDTVGLGTGIQPQQRVLKTALIQQALQRVRGTSQQSLDVQQAMVEFGGFEIVQMVGAMLATAAAGKTIIVDGFIVSVAALLAIKIAPTAQDYMVFSHFSAEHAYQRIIDHIKVTPLLNLDLRLGEGTGAALTLPLLRTAATFYNEMATFESASVQV